MSRHLSSKVDDRILRILERDARQSVVAIAKAINLSRSAVQARIDRLELEGVISQYTIVRGETNRSTNIKALCSIKLISQTDSNQVIKNISQLKEVSNIWMVTGASIDAIALIETSSLDDLRNFRFLLEKTQGVAEIATSVLLKSYP